MRARSFVGAALLALAACYAPSATEGLPCSPGGDCPSGQECVAGVCLRGPGAPDADPASPDADPSAPDAVRADATLVDAAPPPDAATPPNIAFVTAAAFDGNLGGRVGADQHCVDAAAAADLPGTFVAVLHDGVSPITSPLLGSSGWVDTAGVPIAQTPAELASAMLWMPLTRDENGNAQRGTYTLRGTAAGTDHCSGWTSTAGSLVVQSVESFAEQLAYDTCAGTYPLLCAEVGRQAEVALTPTEGLIAFHSSRWTPGDGLAGADAVCQTDAAAADLPGSYLAALTTSAFSAPDRFADVAMPVVRPDGAQIAASVADLYATIYLDTFVSQLADGSPIDGTLAWRGTAAANCDDWTNLAGTGRVGRSYSAQRTSFVGSATVSCNVDRPVLCIQLK
jgi:hypothetical protein